MHVEDMPVTALKKGKVQVNAVEVARLLERWHKLSSEPLVAFLEDVHTMPGQGVTSSGNFMMGKGIIMGVLAAERIAYILVSPQEWKKRAGLIGKDKDQARTKAQQLYPGVVLSRKKDIGRADAILIARYGEKKE
jgi:crossover junction endodeoxyribonuclease RuvC